MIEFVDFYTPDDCTKNPEKFYIYGDNLEGWGKAGQAIIRDCKNAIGIPTKRKPSTGADAYFGDREDELIAIKEAVKRVEEKRLAGYTLVLPKCGIGTGLAKMNQYSPKLFMRLTAYFQKLSPDYLPNIHP